MTKPNVTVPMGNLHAQYIDLKVEIDDAISRVIASSTFIRGPEVDAFEKAFASIVGTRHCVSCANGTDALYIAMVALGVKPGDEVIVPAMSWISTSETVSQTGARVVFCDIDPRSYTMDPTKLPSLVTDRTVGIIPVHLYGHPADMAPILAFADVHGLWVLEDVAQAHMAQYNNHTVGGLGTVGSYSFYPGKNLGAMGDAGAIVTNNTSLATRMAMFARHGGLTKGEHQIEGINSRLDGLQAAVLSVKLPHLNAWTERRRAIANEYLERLSGTLGLQLPTVSSWARHVWHLFVVQHKNRDRFARRLQDLGVSTSINYPCALPFLPCYSKRGHTAAEYPVAYRLSQDGLSLPLYPELTREQIDHVVDCVRIAANED